MKKLALLLGCLWTAESSLVAGNIFLQLDGQKGDVTAPEHRDWIQVDALNSGHQNLPAGGRKSGKVSFNDFNFSRPLDSASPGLFLACAKSTIFPKARFQVAKSNDPKMQVYDIVLGNARVTSVSTSGGEDGSPPVENVSLGFESVQWTYTELNAKGQPFRWSRATWDLVKNAGSFNYLGLSESLPELDSDHDGMPDEWERMHGLNPLVNDADGDLDGDGLTNLQEFNAGTLPEKPDSVFRARYTAVSGAPARLSWSSIPGKTYRVLIADSVDGIYTAFRTVLADVGDETALEIPATEPGRFFRVEVQ